ncbi:MAG: hypothetical protein QOJ40_1136 [Verrucomicrobiota bacterium]
MELRDFAQQVLFATSLEEKLWCPEAITDTRQGPSLITPRAPGRPSELRFKAQGSGQAEFPGLHRLEREEERGRLLHFFANHELLATELMALALLRFPDAPAAFRRGVLQTLKDEQVHTGLYLERMAECGIQFGEIPVSGYFWRSVSGMENPMDYVAALSLTFEQANLDFCRHFSRAFGKVGDTTTAGLLDRIYRDEIGHVAHGLKWFRRWKNPQQSDWDAFCQQLKFPLSPQRAKGITLNVEGRRAAGLEAAFIAELNVYSQSKGRTPVVFVFNPFSEGYIAQGKSFTPAKHQRLLAKDLAHLPQFLCRQDDIVLVPERPAVEFLSGIKEAGFPLPEFIVAQPSLAAGCAGIPARSGHGRQGCRPNPQAGKPALHPSLGHRKLGGLRPWAWGPDSVELFAPLFASVTGEQRTLAQSFNPKIAQLYSKAWSAEFFRTCLETLPDRRVRARGLQDFSDWGVIESWLCTEIEIGTAVNTLQDALEAIEAIRVRGHHKVVVKEAHGLAGHNSIRLWEPELLGAQRGWMARALQNGRRLVIEPWLERELDFSVQLEMGPRGLKLCGYTGLINDAKGQFQANWAAPNHQRRLPSQVFDLLGKQGKTWDGIQRLYTHIFTRLEAELKIAGYLGPLGIDAFVYRTAQGVCRLKPIVEINLRYTMGRLTVELMKQTCPGTHGLFRLMTRAMARKEGFADFVTYARSLTKRFPLRLEGEPKQKIRGGALCLNDPARAQVSLAVFQLGRTLESLMGEKRMESRL